MLTAWQIAARLIPVIREFAKATKKNSDGGKRITPQEKAKIIGAALGGIGEELEAVIDEVNGRQG